jgi:GcrA cell cycle regulator
VVRKKERFLWTTQAVDQLRKLAAERLSTYEIAARMGLPRPAICGKCFREGIPLLGKRGGVSPGSIVPDPNALKPLDQRSGAGPAIAALTARQCAWPLGDPHEDDFHFCCKPRNPGADPPYCEGHTTVHVAKATPKRQTQSWMLT